jgi:nucleoside-diphosphate-sugar epimerase
MSKSVTYKIAVLGATSHIAKDLIVAFSKRLDIELYLFARETSRVNIWLDSQSLDVKHHVCEFCDFNSNNYFAVINFIGVGDPAKAVLLGNKIFEITTHFDNLVLDYLSQNIECKYIHMSSGAVYGHSFEHPVDQGTLCQIPVNNITPQDWYAISKLYVETKHRANTDFSIFDLRIFNYFSSSIDLNTRFLMSDIVNSIIKREILFTSPHNLTRDYLHPEDFCSLIYLILFGNADNLALDSYSLKPVDKFSLLDAMEDKFSLKYKVMPDTNTINATGHKVNYFSKNRVAEKFGYKPKISSLEGLCREVEIIMNRHDRI